MNKISGILTNGAMSLLCLSAVAQSKPNVVLILVDDMGWSDFGCYGSEIKTPTIDSLAYNGLRYRQFYNAARCAPTRCSILTGLYVHQVAVNPAQSLPNLRTDNNVTIAEILGANGYRTYISGKWHLGNKANGRDPISRGFEHGFGMGANIDGSNVKSYWDKSIYGLQSTNNEILWDDYTGRQFYQTDAIGDYSVKFINHHYAKNDGKPFFLYMAFNAGHWPIHAPAEIANKYTDVADSNPSDEDYYNYEVGWDSTRQARYERQKAMGVTNDNYILSPRGEAMKPANTQIPAWESLDKKRRDDLARRMALYAAMIHDIDLNVKKVVDELKRKGQLDNTLIMIVSDNGGNYEDQVFGNPVARDSADLATMGQPDDPSTFPRVDLGGGWANVNNTPLRMYKHFTHEGGIRTPGIVFYPNGMTNKGVWIEQAGHIMDFMPTILEAASINYPSTFKGRTIMPVEGSSLVPHFTGDSIKERIIFEEHESNRALYEGDYKFVTKNMPSFDGSSPAHTWELYNLKNDPSEMNNLAADEPERLMDMIIKWNKKATEVGVPNERLIALDTINIAHQFHFTFDDKITDESPSHYELTPATGYTPRYVEGKFGKALEFNGTSDYLDLTQTGIVNPATDAFTVCAWVYNSAPDNAIPATGGLEQLVLHQLNGRIVVQGYLTKTSETYGTWQGGALYTANNGVLSRNVWQHVAVTFNPSDKTHTYYVNGQPAGQSTSVNPFESVTAGFRVGAHKTGSKGFWYGKIDELYLLPGVLTGDEVIKIMENRWYNNTTIKESQPENIRIYPNPVSAYLHVTGIETPVRLSLFTIDGQLLTKKSHSSSIPVHEVPAGNYILKIERNNGSPLFFTIIVKPFVH